MSERRRTCVEVIYPAEKGEIGLRGSHAPLSWESTTPPTLRDGDRSIFLIEVPEHDLLELKLVRNEDDWAQGPNYTVHAGDALHIEPYFERQQSELLPPETLETPFGALTFQVLLPPSYGEQVRKRYPVLYAQDGQALWSTSQDPYGVWNLEQTLDGLYEIGALRQVIVVAVDHREGRVERLSPMPDPQHGGGEAEKYLKALADVLRPRIDERFRTLTAREDTAVLGSSMGGLFAFYAAWRRPDVFGKAACLSSSFWWADRATVRMAQEEKPPEPRPVFYLDSGAAHGVFEQDANARDGFHHTRSMFRALVNHGYTPGVDVHRLTFPGSTHDAASWASRVAIPLQLLFPPSVRVDASAEVEDPAVSSAPAEALPAVG